MVRRYTAYIIEVSDAPPSFINNANHRTIRRGTLAAQGGRGLLGLKIRAIF